MSLAPILLLGVAGAIALTLARKASVDSATTAPTTAPGKSVKTITEAQKKKVEDWAKKKGLPVSQAIELAKSVYSMKF